MIKIQKSEKISSQPIIRSATNEELFNYKKTRVLAAVGDALENRNKAVTGVKPRQNKHKNF